MKKVIIITLCLLISFNLVACKDKEIQNSNAAASCDSIDFSNINYNNYTLENLTFQYPDFLEIDKKGSDFVAMSTKDSSATLKVYKEKTNSSFRDIYEKDMSNLKNINYDSYKDTRFSVSGRNNDSEYYKSSILLGDEIFSFMIIYPVEYLDAFDGIVTNIYKAFVANLDNNDIQNKDVANNSKVSKKTNRKLQAATVEDNTEDFVKHPRLLPLGDYYPEKEYNTQYGLIVGKNLFNNKTINDPLEYNKVYNIAGSINFPDFLIPDFVPTNGKDIAFSSRDDELYVDMGYCINHGVNYDDVNPYTVYTYLEKKKIDYGNDLLYHEIKGDRLYTAVPSTNRYTNKPQINVTCYTFGTNLEFHYILSFSKDYYREHKVQIDDIFNEMDKSFNPLPEDVLH